MTGTHLYIKQHTITGLKYFGKTTRDPITYLGSGKYWLRHLKKHGNHVNTLWTHYFDDVDELQRVAIALSDMYDIVESDAWANLVVENGLDGANPGVKLSDEHRAKLSKPKPPRSAEHRAKISVGKKGKKLPPRSAEHCAKISANQKGRKLSDEAKEKISIAKNGKKRAQFSEEHRTKLSAASKGRQHSDESRAKMAESQRLRRLREKDNTRNEE